MACGSSDAVTTSDMTQLTSFAGDPTSVMSYGAIAVNSNTSGYVYYTTTHEVTTVEYRYVYVAPADFTCKEFGTYCLVPNSTLNTITSKVNYELDFTQLDAYMFSRVVLTEPVEMTAGETYTFDYTLRFSRTYATVYETTDDVFGLPTVLRRRFDMSSTARTSCTNYVPTITNSKFEIASYTGAIGGSGRSCIGALNYGSNIPGASNLSGSSSKCIASGAPIIFWLTSFDASFSDSMATAPWQNGNGNFQQTGDVVISHEPDILGDFYAVNTYHYKIPYTNTTGKYCTILWANNVWFVNAVSTGASNITQTPYPRNNLYDYTLTCKIILTREEE